MEARGRDGQVADSNRQNACFEIRGLKLVSTGLRPLISEVEKRPTIRI